MRELTIHWAILLLRIVAQNPFLHLYMFERFLFALNISGHGKAGGPFLLTQPELHRNPINMYTKTVSIKAELNILGGLGLRFR